MLSAGQGAVVVGDRVEAEVVREAVHLVGDLRGAGEVAVDGGVEGEHLWGQAHPVDAQVVDSSTATEPKVVDSG